MLATTSSFSNVGLGPKVFINFRGAELRSTFVSNLHEALVRSGINAFIDSEMVLGRKIASLFNIIEDSDLALAILSDRYTESEWCLDELMKMKECSTKGEGCKNLVIIPIFYKLDTAVVRGLEGDFGSNLFNLWKSQSGRRDDRIVKWDAALQDVLSNAGLVFKENGEEKAFVDKIVEKVGDALTQILGQNSEERGAIAKPQKCQSSRASHNSEPEEQRLKQLEDKLGLECNGKETRIVGVVGMPGIGKTYLAEKLFAKLQSKITLCVFIRFDREMSNEQGPEWLQTRLVEGLLDPGSRFAGDWKDRLRGIKMVVVLDNVVYREQIDNFLGSCDWIQKGSKFIITTRDKSLTEGLVSYLYEVPGLNDRDGLELFRARLCCDLEGNFLEMSRKFLDFAGGNPLALMAFGDELKGKTQAQWEARLGTLTHVSSVKLREVLREFYENDLDDNQKDAFLDIVCFFRSQGEKYVMSLLDSLGSNSVEAGREVIDLVDKFLIHISDGRVEMHNLVFTMGKELVDNTTRKYWNLSSNYDVNALKDKEGRDEVRGVVLDMCKMEEMPLNNQAFAGMSSLRYLKVYDSHSPNRSECKLNLPDGLECVRNNILRYLHWMNFPGEELPSDFEPENLIDLWLPYSKINLLWDCAKVALKLKWVNLSHSNRLSSISALSNAPSLLRLNLEGCTSLKELPQEMQNMKDLVFLNLTGCTSLVSLPKITMDSLQTLILSGCSELKTFEVISEHLETLYLNSTSIDGLPPAIGNLHKLIFLNLKDCKNLASLPDCLGSLKSLQELKLSRCSKLKIFPYITKNLRVLLLDGTSITDMPSNITDLSSLRRLCLSGNEEIRKLQFDMGQMVYLKWLELKNCKNLTSLPRLPPNLQCLNAHGCTSLRTVASPLALVMATEQIHSTFNFSNCHKLEQISKNAIISYIQKKNQLMSDDRYDEDFIFKSLLGTCFPGCEIPACFNHQAPGPVLKLELPQDWNACRFIGIALCVVVSFNGYTNHNNGQLQVKCTCEFVNVSISPESFIVGGWSDPCVVEGDHILIGYTTLSSIKKRQRFSSATEVSLRFDVTNGTSEVADCKVVSCGFSLVYESDDNENANWESPLTVDNSRQGQSSSSIDGGYPDEASDGTPTPSPTTAVFRRMGSFLNIF